MKITSKMPRIDNQLLYRRQFFLGPHSVDYLTSWNKQKVDSNYYLTTHPDLDVTIAKANNSKLILLGFILDPEYPLFDNDQILNDLLEKNNNFDMLLKNTNRYGGRWALIYSNNKDFKIFTDAAGSRSVFYHFDGDQAWCASQPHTIAELLKIDKRDDQDFIEFISSKEFKQHENTLFGDDTLFKNIYHLLPNHYLSIREKVSKRFWPSEPVKEASVKSAIQQIAPIIKNLYKAADSRFKLIQPVTAGRDTRFLLAASKDVSQNIYYFVQKFKRLSHFSKDIRIPKRLLKLLELDFHIKKCNDYNSEFDKYLKKNVFMIQSNYKKVLHYNFFKNFQGKVNVSGNYTGIYRPFKWQVFAPPNTSLINRTIGRKFRKYKYVVDYISEWERTYNINLAKYNYSDYDIFYWENKAANWVSMFVNELDIAIEEWCPINNREILSTILAVDHAKSIEENLQQQLVEYLWPDTLKLPLAKVGEDNPIRNIITKLLFNFLRATGLFYILKKIANRKNLI